VSDLLPAVTETYRKGIPARAWLSDTWEGRNNGLDQFARLIASAKIDSDDPTFPDYALPHLKFDLESPIGTLLSRIRLRSLEPPLKGLGFELYDPTGPGWAGILFFDATDPDPANWFILYSGKMIPATPSTYDLGLFDQRWRDIFLDRYSFLGNVASLPTPTSAYRGAMIRVEGGTGVADKLYVCMKSATGTYSWVQTASG